MIEFIGGLLLGGLLFGGTKLTEDEKIELRQSRYGRSVSPSNSVSTSVSGSGSTSYTFSAPTKGKQEAKLKEI
jgi:hypothetical protein